ncbi:hypothetical protein [Tenacibaculum xiamenense]|uniref:hypothetical protein n=1 Tax=Tenacibaculum xiamenense TaxID=1261553 RepID=UPI00389603AC
MKLILSIVNILWFTAFFAQEKLSKVEEITSKEVVINSKGLDDLVIKNSKDNFLRVSLDNKNSGDYYISTNKISGQIEISFKSNDFVREEIFRKFITNRVSGVNAVVEVPVGKSITVYGEDLGVKSKSYKGDLSVYIKRGNIYLNKIEGTCNMSFFQGNLYTSNANFNMNINSNKGKVLLNGEERTSPFARNEIGIQMFLKVITIHGNIFINSN